MKCLILGAGGFLGRNLCSCLLADGHNVVAYERHTSLENNPGAIRVSGDFTTEGRWPDLLAGVDVCFHLISSLLPGSSNDAAQQDIRENVAATIPLLDAATRTETHIVFASSGGTVYGAAASNACHEDTPTEPICAYGISKLTIEKYLGLYRRLYGLESTILRVANAYGEHQAPDRGQGAVAVFLDRILHSRVIDVWGDGSALRDYIHISDVCEAFRLVADRRACGIFNVGTGIGTSVNDLIFRLASLTGRPARVQHLEERKFDVSVCMLSTEKIRKQLGWRPQLALDEGLRRTFEWQVGHAG